MAEEDINLARQAGQETTAENRAAENAAERADRAVEAAVENREAAVEQNVATQQKKAFRYYLYSYGHTNTAESHWVISIKQLKPLSIKRKRNHYFMYYLMNGYYLIASWYYWKKQPLPFKITFQIKYIDENYEKDLSRKLIIRYLDFNDFINLPRPLNEIADLLTNIHKSLPRYHQHGFGLKQFEKWKYALLINYVKSLKKDKEILIVSNKNREEYLEKYWYYRYYLYFSF